MPPSCSPFRCFVVLLLVAAAGLLARPAEASKRLFAGIVDSAARRHGVDPDLVHAVIAVESGYRATAQSPAGAQGLMQLMPGTQRDLGIADAFDPQQNVDAGVAYLRRLTDEFGTVLAIAAYNAGPGAVRRYNGIPPYAETRAYVRAVLDRGRTTVGAKATEEHDPSTDRALAVAEADVTEDAAAADRRLQDDHLAMDAAAGQPRMLDAALDPDYRTAAPPDQLVMLRDAKRGRSARVSPMNARYRLAAPDRHTPRRHGLSGSGSSSREAIPPTPTGCWTAARVTKSLRTAVSGPSSRKAADPCRIGRIWPMRTGLNPSVPRDRPAPSHAAAQVRTVAPPRPGGRCSMTAG